MYINARITQDEVINYESISTKPFVLSYRVCTAKFIINKNFDILAFLNSIVQKIRMMIDKQTYYLKRLGLYVIICSKSTCLSR